MSKAIWLLVEESDWCEAQILYKESHNMMDSIHVGSHIDVELSVAIGNAWLTSACRNESDGPVPVSEPVLESIGEGLPLCHFLGRVLNVFGTGLPDPSAEPPLRGVARFRADLDCGLPVCLTGPMAAGGSVDDIEGEWIEGVGEIVGNPSNPHCPLERKVRGEVKNITESSVLLCGTPTVYRIIEFEPIAPDLKPVEDQG